MPDIETAIREMVRAEVERQLAALAARADAPASAWLTTAEVARLEGRSTKTVRTWIRQGLPARRHGQQLRVRRADLEAWRGRAGPGRGAAGALATRVLRAL